LELDLKDLEKHYTEELKQIQNEIKSSAGIESIVKNPGGNGNAANPEVVQPSARSNSMNPPPPPANPTLKATSTPDVKAKIPAAPSTGGASNCFAGSNTGVDEVSRQDNFIAFEASDASSSSSNISSSSTSADGVKAEILSKAEPVDDNHH
jgi:hypothetical protein